MTNFHAWKNVCKAWKTLASTSTVWFIFQMVKTDVPNSHWPNFEDLNVSQLIYDVWSKYFTTLRHVGEGVEVKTNLHLMSQAKLKNYKNEQIVNLEGFEYGYCNESPSNCECEGLSKLHVAYRKTLCTRQMTMIRFFYI